MATMQDKIMQAKKIEDFCNTLRNEMNYLQNQKRILERENKNTSKIAKQIDSYEKALSPAWDNFEILLNEIGAKKYYEHFNEISFKEMNDND